MHKILLVGYMASGKSTVGRKLADVLDIPFFDLDDIIEASEQLAIKEIFKSRGEVYFRKIEHLFLNNFLNTHTNFVLSLGGGTPCYANNHEILQQEEITSIYLKTSISEIVSRLLNSNNQRPLVMDKDEEELTEYVAKHLFDRSYYYHQSKFTVLTDGKTTASVVNDITNILT